MSVVSDASDAETPLDGSFVTLDDGLRTLIVITGIWVAFREGWSDNFRYGDLVSSSSAKSIMSPTSVKHLSPTIAKNETDSFPNNDEDGKRCMSVSSIRRSTAPSTVDRTQFDGLSRRSNSTGAAFMDRAKRRSASGLTTRLNRHSMFTTLDENGRDIVVSRPASPRQPSAEVEDSSRASQPKPKSPTKAQPERENTNLKFRHYTAEQHPQEEAGFSTPRSCRLNFQQGKSSPPPQYSLWHISPKTRYSLTFQFPIAMYTPASYLWLVHM